MPLVTNLLHFAPVMRLLVIATTFLASHFPARGEDVLCTANVAERVACIAGKLCMCRFAPGRAAAGLDSDFRWDCSILRPACGGEVPATIDAWTGPLPETVVIDKSRTIINDESKKPRDHPRGY